MKAKRLVLVLAPITCVFFVVLFTQLFRDDSPKASASGEHLNFESLAPDEAICIERADVGSRGETFSREYRVNGGIEPVLQAFKASGSIARDDEKETVVRQLSNKQLRGLDETLAYLRKTPMQYCSALFKYTYSYFRGENKIGEEVFINNMAIVHLNDLYAYRDVNKDYVDSEYPRFATDYGIQLADIVKFITVEMLAENRPNKALEPTTPSVTPAADAPVAPAGVAAHL